MTDHITEIVKVLGRDRPAAGYDDPEAVAQAWADEGFSADEVADWLDAGCFEPLSAGLLRDAGITPRQASRLGGYRETVAYLRRLVESGIAVRCGAGVSRRGVQRRRGPRRRDDGQDE
jgi:hypothetical protein